MSRMHNAVLPVALLFSALALSACATKPKEATVAEPAPAATVVEQTAAPVSAASVAEQPAPAAMAEQPAPKPVVAKKKAHKKAKPAAPKEVAPEPVVAPAPAPVMKQEPVVAQPEPTPPPVVVAPLQKTPAPGLLEQYWLWLLGIVIAVVAILWMRKKD